MVRKLNLMCMNIKLRSSNVHVFTIIGIVMVSVYLLAGTITVEAGGGGAGGNGGGNGGPSGGPIHSTVRTTPSGTTHISVSQGGRTTSLNDFNGDGDFDDPNEHRIDSNRDGGGNNNFTRPSPSTPTTPTCTQTSDLATIDILFVRAGTYSGSARPAASLLVSESNLQAGTAYQPIVQIRNLNCNSTSAFNNDNGPKIANAIEKLLSSLSPHQALASGGGGSRAVASTLSGYHINQLPFGTGGGFPVRLRIDFGQNGSYEYTEFLNNQGPVRGIPLPTIRPASTRPASGFERDSSSSRNQIQPQSPSSGTSNSRSSIVLEKAIALVQPTTVLANGGSRASTPRPPTPTPADLATIYVAFPAFTPSEIGIHSITANADVTNTQAAGRGCTSMVAAPARSGFSNTIRSAAAPTVSPIDWGCLNELTPAGARSEGNNNFTKTFTVGRSQVLVVSVADVYVRVGGTLATVPFTVLNQSTSTLPGYTYTIRINNTSVGSGTRTLTMAPGVTDSTRGAVSYTIPNSPTTVPLEVCASSAILATTTCANARVIVTTTECSDSLDNDGDGTRDDRDNGCFSDPMDPTTYDPNDNSEGGMIDLIPPSLSLTSNKKFVRSNETVTINYSISAPYAITCVVSGGGINQTIMHTPGTTEGSVTSQELQNKQQFTLRCPGFATLSTRVIDSSTTLFIEVVPQIQEV